MFNYNMSNILRWLSSIQPVKYNSSDDKKESDVEQSVSENDSDEINPTKYKENKEKLEVLQKIIADLYENYTINVESSKKIFCLQKEIVKLKIEIYDYEKIKSGKKIIQYKGDKSDNIHKDVTDNNLLDDPEKEKEIDTLMDSILEKKLGVFTGEDVYTDEYVKYIKNAEADEKVLKENFGCVKKNIESIIKSNDEKHKGDKNYVPFGGKDNPEETMSDYEDNLIEKINLNVEYRSGPFSNY